MSHASELTREQWEDCNKVVELLEHHIIGSQRMRFKIFKQLQLEEKDQLKIHVITTEWQKVTRSY
jgi:hypothetical protein